MLNERTLYTIIDEQGNKSTITLNKLIADVLQNYLPDIHAWIQAKYDLIYSKNQKLNRVRRGDIIRLLAQREAEKFPAFYQKIEAFL